MTNPKIWFLSALMAGTLLSCRENKTGRLTPPDVKKADTLLTAHGDSRIDSYYWLNQRDNPEVIAYLEAENAYSEAFLKHTGDMRNTLFEEITGRIKQDDRSVPYELNGYTYYIKYGEGMEYPVVCRMPAGDGKAEEVLLNINEMAKGYAYFNVADWTVSPDNRLVAYSVDTVSRRKYSIYVKNLVTGEVYPDQISNTGGEITWANDNKTLFYTTKDETLRPCKVFSHILGSSPETDKMVYHEEDSTFRTNVYKSRSWKYIMIVSESTLSSEVMLLDADNPSGDVKIFHPREKEMLYTVYDDRERFFVLTNDNALNFKLMTTPAGKTGKQHWKEFIPHRSNVLLRQAEVFENHLVLLEKKDGLDQLRIMQADGKKDSYVDFGEAVYTIGFSNNYSFTSPNVRIDYSSLTTPSTVFDIALEDLGKTLLKQDEVLGGFNRQDYISERLFAIAGDGAKIPVSLVYRKGLKKDGTSPIWIKGYGAYGYDSDPYFSSVRLSLLDRGFIFAIAHVRGGQEMGRQWYEDGKLLNKMNTFTDFITCTEFLISEGYTSANKTVAWGGSAGGLLVGAVMNMRPELYRAMIAAVPFVDVVTTMLDESIPLTTAEYDEWGNPNDKVYYDYMLSYSPYDNVESKDYPALLVTTGLHDSQVQYWEPAKWVARLRDHYTGENPLLFVIQMDYGHGGASGRFERYKEIALEYTFVFDLLGISL
ncbi:MAG: S9 family peptidase [Bacteroidales bacterium]|nr:S9 family peptidase [Bacteroidales bacterium]